LLVLLVSLRVALIAAIISLLGIVWGVTITTSAVTVDITS